MSSRGARLENFHGIGRTKPPLAAVFNDPRIRAVSRSKLRGTISVSGGEGEK